MNNAFNLNGSGQTSSGLNTFWSTEDKKASTGSQWFGGWAKYPEMPVKMAIQLRPLGSHDVYANEKPQRISVGYVEPTNDAYESWDILFSESDGPFLFNSRDEQTKDLILDGAIQVNIVDTGLHTYNSEQSARKEVNFKQYTPQDYVWDFFAPYDEGIDNDSWEISIREDSDWSSSLLPITDSMTIDSIGLYVESSSIDGISLNDDMTFYFVLRNTTEQECYVHWRVKDKSGNISENSFC